MIVELRTLHNCKVYLLLVFFFALNSEAQIISMFTWDANPVTTASIGPNATSAGGSATSSPGGVGGTNGLNPGAPTAANINLTIPNTGNIFDIPNIDIKIDYRRNENSASMLKRANFNFNVGNAVGSFQVTYRVGVGAGFATITSTAYPIPLDATFRTYRFTYNNCTGVGTMYVNSTVVWTSPTPTVNTDLYWVGEGSIIVGQDMDGANNNVPNLDNFVLQPFPCSTLPISLASFAGKREGLANKFTWETLSEKNNSHFVVLRSSDGSSWQEIGRVEGAGTTSAKNKYSFVEQQPTASINYYRLQQIDFDGTTELFSIVSIDNVPNTTLKMIKVTDVLGRQLPVNAEGLRFEHYSDGTVLKVFSQ